MAKFILFLLLNTLSLILCGQEEILKGSISADSLKGFEINIVNYSQKLGTTNDDSGYFEIPARSGDSIVFSSVMYEVQSRIITEKDLIDTIIQVQLNLRVNRLEEVKVSTINLSGFIGKDVLEIEIVPFVNNKYLGLPFNDIEQPVLIDRRIYTATSTALDLLLNVLTGKLKQLKKIKELNKLEDKVHQAKNTFANQFFTNELKIPEESVWDFIYYCSQDDYFENMLAKSQELSLLEFFQEKAVFYRSEYLKN